VKILYISIYDPHVPLNGAGVRGRAFVNHLSRCFDVDLIFMTGAGQPPLAEPTNTKGASLSSVSSKRKTDFSYFGYFVFSRDLYHMASTMLSQQPYDFIFCDHSVSGIYGLLLSRRFGVPFIYSSHNVEYLAYRDRIKEDKRRLALLPYIYGIERMAAKKSRILISISQDEADFFASWTDKRKIILIPQGFDEELYNPFYERIKSDKKVVLFCGNFRNSFSIEAVKVTINRIVDRVVRHNARVKFLFIGAYPPVKTVHPHVEYTDFIDHYPNVLKQADAVISPMLRGHGMPTKVLEALACGKPTIATPTGARSICFCSKLLHVCNIGEMPNVICRVLRQKPVVDLHEFNRLKLRYEWKNIIAPLCDVIEKQSFNNTIP
jgi:glycosyltransferase involved in cell wall biosynthesis